MALKPGEVVLHIVFPEENKEFDVACDPQDFISRITDEIRRNTGYSYKFYIENSVGTSIGRVGTPALLNIKNGDTLYVYELVSHAWFSPNVRDYSICTNENGDTVTITEIVDGRKNNIPIPMAANSIYRGIVNDCRLPPDQPLLPSFRPRLSSASRIGELETPSWESPGAQTFLESTTSNYDGDEIPFHSYSGYKPDYKPE